MRMYFEKGMAWQILKHINNLGAVDALFLVNSLKRKSEHKRQSHYYIKNIIQRLEKDNLVKNNHTVSGIQMFTLTEHSLAILKRANEYVNRNVINVMTGNFGHHSQMSLAISAIHREYQCPYKTEYILRDLMPNNCIPDFAVFINKKRVFFEIERFQKSDSALLSKLSIYNFQYRNDIVIYLVETPSLIQKINKIKNGFDNSSNVFCFMHSDFCNNVKMYIDPIVLSSQLESIC